MPCPNHISVGFRDCGIVGANLCDDLGERHLRRLGSDKSCEVCGIRIHGLVGDPQGHGSPKDMFFFLGGEAYHKGFPSLGVPGIRKTHTTDSHESTK